ncbi:protein STRUBBELIG-RECEPTOR FAMILY 3-like [Impatiens glandulifera]|uniref:protein STRUBBELIG-RECEPTOR FAMILY 3-like n=1 Tax=Impatiens glandulifera TaxID=253017 RepID=UPI001FB19975|nr:protein STRUBBELIG-RECEPTOR FAMILY 3-like [Impatiens glandulifera]
MVYFKIFTLLFTAFWIHACRGFTDSRDVSAINSLYAALGSPPLRGWMPFGGDPCVDVWQGVQCVNANITGIVLNGANLGGELGDNLQNFTSIILMDLRNNHIGGSIPSNLPITIRSFFLSGNQLSGSIPETLSILGQSTDLLFDNNNLTGEIPDAFQQLTSLTNLDLSSNKLSGHLPPSMASLSSITALHVENNQLIGTLDVLQDLPLQDLDVENNLFSGPIPAKLLNVPNFRKEGNPFNTTIIPSPPSFPPSVSPLRAPSPASDAGGGQENGPPIDSTIIMTNSSTGQNFWTTKMGRLIIIGGVLTAVVLSVGLCLFLCGCFRRRRTSGKIGKRQDPPSEYSDSAENPKQNTYFPSSLDNNKTGKKATARHELGDKHKHEKASLRSDNDGTASISMRKEDHEIDLSSVDSDFLQPPPPPPFFSLNKPTVNSNSVKPPQNRVMPRAPIPVRIFTVSSLQQYTNSFSEESFIGEGILGVVYRAELPSGELLAVKKLDTVISTPLSSEGFLELVSHLSKLQHPNVVELVGYCSQYDQQLLAYKYCQNGTLHEALHWDVDDIHKKLSWKTRVRLTLGVARALEYLHEVCQPPIMHQNLKSSNILLDDDLAVRVSDCGLAPLMPSELLRQLLENGYGAPEVESGTYTCQSDVYSFGVVMLELLTGRKSYDRSRPRGEQFLVRWAVPQLHDIDSLSRMVDPSLNGAYPTKSLSRFADIIFSCIQAEPEFRPPMSEIVESLLHVI